MFDGDESSVKQTSKQDPPSSKASSNTNNKIAHQAIDDKPNNNKRKRSAKDKSKKQQEKRPKKKIRYDRHDHLPHYDSKDAATRCKNEKCKYSTHVYCSKCNVHLCCTIKRNCFTEFHTNDDNIEKNK